MRFILKLAAILSLSTLGLAQSTFVTAVVSDTSGQTWNNGTYAITFIPTPGKPGPFYWNGVLYNPQGFTGALDGSGAFSVALPDNSFITPSGTQWKFIVCPQASFACHTVQTAVTGTSMSLTTAISANNPPIQFNPTPFQYGYSDSEVLAQPGAGQQYFNVTSKQPEYWDGSAWQDFPTGGSFVQTGPTGSQTVTQPVNTNLNVITSGTGQFTYNGSNILTSANAGGSAIVPNPSGNQTVTQPINTNFNFITSGSGTLQHNGNTVLDTTTGVQLNPSATQTITEPTATTLGVTISGTATGRTSVTPLQYFTMTDASALATDNTLAGDVHLTPYFRSSIVSSGPNDDAAYEAIQCNYTGGGSTGNCIPHFFIASSVAGDKHTGIWGGNAIVTEQVNTPSFGWETNTFNQVVDGHILANGNYDAGPFFGVAATAGHGTGEFTQQAAFVAVNDFLAGSGGGWDYDFYAINANVGAVLCGTPTTTTIPNCIVHSAYGVATSSNNYGAVPDEHVVELWNGSSNAQHVLTEVAVPSVSSGTTATFCKDTLFDATVGFQVCGNGSGSNFASVNGPLNVNSGSNIIYRCSVAGTLRAGQLTSVAADCGTAVDTGLRTP